MTLSSNARPVVAVGRGAQGGVATTLPPLPRRAFADALGDLEVFDTSKGSNAQHLD